MKYRKSKKRNAGERPFFDGVPPAMRPKPAHRALKERESFPEKYTTQNTRVEHRASSALRASMAVDSNSATEVNTRYCAFCAAEKAQRRSERIAGPGGLPWNTCGRSFTSMEETPGM
nr:hypothetical protein Iba_chr12aCG18690 [Ipomoea batatas]GMD85357.1 hypothetical protein Iba_scaffold365073CG0010 [Ipomoea batatas]